MGQQYHDAQRVWQDRLDGRRLAETTTETSSPEHRSFIEARDMFFLSTAADEGWPQYAYKDGESGFVRVIDDRTLVEYKDWFTWLFVQILGIPNPTTALPCDLNTG